MTIFFHLLITAGIDAIVMLRGTTPHSKLRRCFLRHIARSFTLPCIQKRSTINTMPRDLKQKVEEYVQNKSEEKDEVKKRKKVKRCVICRKGEDI